MKLHFYEINIIKDALNLNVIIALLPRLQVCIDFVDGLIHHLFAAGPVPCRNLLIIPFQNVFQNVF